MKKSISLLTLCLVTFQTFAVELNYKWKANTSYSFGATIVDNISNSIMEIRIQDKYTTTVDFTLAISAVDAQGTASGTLYVTNFNVKDSKGISVASLLNLPKNTVKSEVKVDRKGNFTFLKKIYLATTPTTNALVYGNVNENGGMAGALVDGQNVEVFAEFDPKTGKLKAGYSVSTLSNTKKVELTENEENDEIDIIPYDLLQFLVLPDGDVKLNDKLQVKAGVFSVEEHVKSLTPEQAIITHKIGTDKNSDMFSGGAKGSSGDGSSDFDMGDFGGTSQMDLDADDQLAINAAYLMTPTFSGELSTTFDVVNGVFLNSKGTITSTLEAMEIEFKVVPNNRKLIFSLSQNLFHASID